MTMAFAGMGMTIAPTCVILYMPTKGGITPHRKYKEDSIMTHKLITTLLCLVLAVALPLAALADTRHTLTLIPGDDLSAVPAIADLCDALSLTLTKGEKSGGLTLSVGGEDIATVALGADSTGLYAQSTLLGDDV